MASEKQSTIKPILEARAHFPAVCVPALAAFQDPKGFGPYSGAKVEPHPQKPDTWVRLTATDGYNLLCLNVSGRCEKPFYFNLPSDFVSRCRKPEPFTMICEGDEYPMEAPAWMVPETVLLLGAKYADEHRELTHLYAHIGPSEPHPDNEELGIGGFRADIGFNPLASWNLEQAELVKNSASEIVADPFAPRALELIGSLPSVFREYREPIHCLEAATHHFFLFGKSWAATGRLSAH